MQVARLKVRAMPAYARKEIVDETVVGIYHCVSRCVRRAFLCGVDRYSGRNFDHRKVWMQERLEQLAAIFAVDILGFSVMSNHVHLLVRNRPEVVGAWNDEDVARRWYRLHPWRRNEDGTPAEPQPCELAAMQADPELLTEYRRRLSSLPWLIRSLCEPIARRANREDHATGRFWEGRYKSQRILDETALLACSIYIDLNPIRASIAETPETSEFTAAFERIAARQQTAARFSRSAPPADGVDAGPSTHADGRGAWLSPVPDADVRATDGNSAPTFPNRRASERGFLPITLDEYLELLEWTGRQVREGKRGVIRADLRPILERLHIKADAWIDTIERFGRAFHRVVGRVSSMAALAATRGRSWYQGVTASRIAFG